MFSGFYLCFQCFRAASAYYLCSHCFIYVLRFYAAGAAEHVDADLLRRIKSDGNCRHDLYRPLFLSGVDACSCYRARRRYPGVFQVANNVAAHTSPAPAHSANGGQGMECQHCDHGQSATVQSA